MAESDVQHHARPSPINCSKGVGWQIPNEGVKLEIIKASFVGKWNLEARSASVLSFHNLIGLPFIEKQTAQLTSIMSLLWNVD